MVPGGVLDSGTPVAGGKCAPTGDNSASVRPWPDRLGRGPRRDLRGLRGGHRRRPDPGLEPRGGGDLRLEPAGGVRIRHRPADHSGTPPCHVSNRAARAGRGRPGPAPAAPAAADRGPSGRVRAPRRDRPHPHRQRPRPDRPRTRPRRVGRAARQPVHHGRGGRLQRPGRGSDLRQRRNPGGRGAGEQDGLAGLRTVADRRATADPDLRRPSQPRTPGPVPLRRRRAGAGNRPARYGVPDRTGPVDLGRHLGHHLAAQPGGGPRRAPRRGRRADPIRGADTRRALRLRRPGRKSRENPDQPAQRARRARRAVPGTAPRRGARHRSGAHQGRVPLDGHP